MDLFGAEQIIRTLIKHGTSKHETRTHEERYNIIMDAIYGNDAEDYLIKSPSNRPRERSIIKFELLLVEMYEAEQEQEYKTYRELAEDFVDETHFIGERNNAIKRLAARYSKNKDRLSSTEERDLIKHRNEIDDNQWGYDGCLHEEMMRLNEVLWENGWPSLAGYE